MARVERKTSDVEAPEDLCGADPVEGDQNQVVSRGRGLPAGGYRSQPDQQGNQDDSRACDHSHLDRESTITAATDDFAAHRRPKREVPMRPDAYTKAVLTVIAGGLLWLCAMQTGRPLAAQQALTLEKVAPQPVVIVGWGTLDEAGTDDGDHGLEDRTGRRQSDPTIPVKLVSVPAAPIEVRLNYTDREPMPVGVTRIKPAGEWEPIRSAAEPEPTRPKPGGR